MKLISHMPPGEFDIRTALGITVERSMEIEQRVQDIYEFVLQQKGLFEMGTIIEDCLNKIPVDTKEAVWTIVLVMKFENLLKHSKTEAVN